MDLPVIEGGKPLCQGMSACEGSAFIFKKGIWVCPNCFHKIVQYETKQRAQFVAGAFGKE